MLQLHEVPTVEHVLGLNAGRFASINGHVLIWPNNFLKLVPIKYDQVNEVSVIEVSDIKEPIID